MNPNSETPLLRTRPMLESIEAQILSPFAAKSADGCRTRLVEEQEHPYRTSFQRDRDRVIHSRAFRRLKHKRQVFLVSYGDHYRTRLTHTLEVSQLSRTIARALGLNEDLLEAIALAHDMGHTPFGHIGEVVLHRIMKGEDDLDGTVSIGDAGGFKHNYQSVRIVDSNETKYQFEGLNLTAFVREGILKHTRLRRADVDMQGFKYEGLSYELDDATTLEGQIVAVCDEIAQRTHDLEDGLRAHYVSLEQVRTLPLVRFIEEQRQMTFDANADRFLYRNRLIRKLVDILVSDVIAQTLKNMTLFYQQTGRTRFFDRRIAWFSDEIDPKQVELDRFIMKEIIEVASAERSDDRAETIIRALFKYYFLHPNLMPAYRLTKCLEKTAFPAVYDPEAEEREGIHDRLRRSADFARSVCDHVAGMTDHYAEADYERLNHLTVNELLTSRADLEPSGI
jgi:dGTPase